MLTNLKEYLKPGNLKEAWEIYQKDPDHTLFSTGGLSTSLREDDRTKIIVDLNDLLSNEIKVSEDKYLIGGGMTINEGLASLKSHALSQVLKQVGTNQIRNMATISGSIAQKYGWSDIITALVAYKAQVQIFNEGGKSFVPIDEYLHSKESAIVLSVLIEKKFNFGSFHCISRTDYDVSQFNLFLCAQINDNGRLLETGIAYGARPGYAKRFKEGEEILADLPLKEIEGKLVALTEKIEQVIVSNGFGLSAEYRKELFKVFLKRSIIKLIKNNGK